VVGEQRPREDGEPGPVDDLRQTGDELGAILVITKEQAPLDAPHHHLVQGPGGIEARTTRHGRHGTTVTQAKSMLSTISTLRPLIRPLILQHGVPAAGLAVRLRFEDENAVRGDYHMVDI
jgi:hypothetical protein